MRAVYGHGQRQPVVSARVRMRRRLQLKLGVFDNKEQCNLLMMATTMRL